MNKDQAQSEYLNILKQYFDDKDKIIKDAKAKGTLKPGLDSNKELFAELDKEFHNKIELLKTMVN